MKVDITAARRHGLTNLNKIDALLYLAEGVVSMTALAKRLRISTAATTHLVDDLEKLGLIQRVRHPRDRRGLDLHITSRGQEVRIIITAAEAVPA